jgi:uncharacterized protein YceH (UPF0502 family)
MEIDKTARRIVGALLEKKWSTPEQYPLTLNALVLACNQKSNRDPEVHFESFLVEGCVTQLRYAELLTIVDRDVGRTLRYAERLSEKLDLSRQQQAIVAELLLRGPQTASELVRRCERMAHFENEGEVEGILRGMAEQRWAQLMPREPGQRQQRWKHLFTPAGEEPEAPPHTPVADAPRAVETARPSSPSSADLNQRLEELRAEVAELRARIEQIENGGAG